MKTRAVLQLLLVVSVFAVLSACKGVTPAPSAVDKLFTERAVIDGIVLNHDGVFTVVDVKTGQPIPSCAELEKTDKKCKYQFGMEGSPPGVKIIKDETIRIVDFVGSHCRAYVSLSSGKEYEICRPPY